MRVLRNANQPSTSKLRPTNALMRPGVDIGMGLYSISGETATYRQMRKGDEAFTTV